VRTHYAGHMIFGAKSAGISHRSGQVLVKDELVCRPARDQDADLMQAIVRLESKDAAKKVETEQSEVEEAA
jgi:hypothetical protein